MKALAVLFFLLGILALFQPENDGGHEKNMARAVAANFAAYRQAAFRYCYAHRHVVGLIQRNVLPLPQGYAPLRDWQARVVDGYLYVHGPGNYMEAIEVSDLFSNTYAIGLNENGHILPQIGVQINIPAFIPEGHIVSVTGIDFKAEAAGP